MRAPNDPEHALISVGEWLAELGYEFTTITPESHRRVLARAKCEVASSVRDVFGWSLPFERALLPAEIVDALRTGGVLEERGEHLRSLIRLSSLRGRLYVHSAYPTDHEHAVFFGPDTYRFCAALAQAVTGARRVVDLGAGTGAGGISLAERCDLITLADCNPLAATYARVNAHLAGCADRVELAIGDLFEAVTGPVELVIANPPYIADVSARVYCDGGGDLGTGLSLRIVEESLARLAPGGKLVLYTGSPIQDGVDPIKKAVTPVLAHTRWRYRELDPDVFGEELATEAYADVDRIAAVLLTVET
ncbi:MAG TPA: class I SAM-dependent methyltransferase [Kofleriaceae bacterium]